MIGDNIVFEEGEGADDQLRSNLPLKLQDLPAGGFRDGSTLTVEDFQQDANLNIHVFARSFDDEDETSFFRIVGKNDVAITKALSIALNNDNNIGGSSKGEYAITSEPMHVNDVDEVEILEELEIEPSSQSAKRKRKR